MAPAHAGGSAPRLQPISSGGPAAGPGARLPVGSLCQPGPGLRPPPAPLRVVPASHPGCCARGKPALLWPLQATHIRNHIAQASTPAPSSLCASVCSSVKWAKNSPSWCGNVWAQRVPDRPTGARGPAGWNRRSRERLPGPRAHGSRPASVLGGGPQTPPDPSTEDSMAGSSRAAGGRGSLEPEAPPAPTEARTGP